MTTFLKIIALALCVPASFPLYAQRRRAMTPPAGVLSIEFVDMPAQGVPLIVAGSDAWIDVRTLSHQGEAVGKPVRVHRLFGIRIVRTGGVSWGTATITARLASLDGRSTIRVDGQSLTAAPIVIGSHFAIGAVTVHELDLEVATSVLEGPLAASIAWEVTTQ